MSTLHLRVQSAKRLGMTQPASWTGTVSHSFLSTLLLTTICAIGAEVADPPAASWLARDLSCKTIYHSSQSPGYTSWVGAWIMSDESLMVTFKQVTGPMERVGFDHRLTIVARASMFPGINVKCL